MSGTEPLHVRHFFSTVPNDYRGGLWKDSCMNKDNWTVAPTDTAKAFAVCRYDQYTDSAKALVASTGAKGTDVCHEIVSFLVEAGRFHRSIDTSAALSNKNGYVKDTYDTLKRTLDIAFAVTNVAPAVAPAVGVTDKANEIPGGWAARDLSHGVAMRTLNAAYVQYVVDRQHGASHSTAFAGLTTLKTCIQNILYNADKRFGNFHGFSTKLNSALANRNGLSVSTKHPSVDHVITNMVNEVYQALGNSFNDTYNLSGLASPPFAEFGNAVEAVGSIGLILSPGKTSRVAVHQNAMYAAIGNVLRQEFPNTTFITLAQDAPWGLYQRLRSKFNLPGTKAETNNFYTSFLELYRRNGNTWSRVDLNTPVADGERDNFRLNLVTSSRGIPKFANSFFKLPGDCTGVIYPTGNGTYARAQMPEEAQASCAVDCHPARFILKAIYLAAYHNIDGKTTTDISIGAGGTFTQNIKLPGLYLDAQVPAAKYFSINPERLIAHLWKLSVEREKLADDISDSNNVTVLVNDGTIYRDEEGNWRRFDPDPATNPMRKTEDYDYTSEAVRKEINQNGCKVIGFTDRNDPANATRCHNFIVDVLAGGKPEEIATALAEFGNQDFFQSARYGAIEMHPQLAITILKGFGFAEVAGEPLNGRAVREFEQVDSWVKHASTPNIQSLLARYPNVKEYLSTVVKRANGIRSGLNPGIENPATGSGSFELPEFASKLGLTRYLVNPYNIRANVFYGAANQVAAQSVAALPTGLFNVTVVDQIPRLASMIGGGRQTGGAAALPSALEFNRKNWEAAMAAPPRGKSLGKTITDATNADLLKIEELQKRRAPLMRELLFGKMVAAAVGDHSPEVFKILDLQAKEKKYSELMRGLNTSSFRFNRNLAGIFQYTDPAVALAGAQMQPTRQQIYEVAGTSALSRPQQQYAPFSFGR